MECRSCGSENAAGRRYCRECGGRLGACCPVCAFFNLFEDAYCGGCGRRVKSGNQLVAEPPPGGAYAPAVADDMGIAEEGAPPVAGGAAARPEQDGVSQSEIDGLFENILDEAPAEGGE